LTERARGGVSLPVKFDREILLGTSGNSRTDGNDYHPMLDRYDTAGVVAVTVPSARGLLPHRQRHHDEGMLDG
jgi:hypothetical protein